MRCVRVDLAPSDTADDALIIVLGECCPPVFGGEDICCRRLSYPPLPNRTPGGNKALPLGIKGNIFGAGMDYPAVVAQIAQSPVCLRYAGKCLPVLLFRERIVNA